MAKEQKETSAAPAAFQTETQLSIAAVLGLLFLPFVFIVPYYINVVVTASSIVFCGSHLSLRKLRAVEAGDEDVQIEKMTAKDAYTFPIVGSCVLFSLYLLFKFAPKEWINAALTLYFVAIGIFALHGVLHPVVSKVLPGSLLALKEWNWKLFTDKDSFLAKWLASDGPWKIDLHPSELFSLSLSLAFGVWYGMRKHWCANNLLGAAFSVRGIEMFSIGSYKTGCILLAGLFLYDIFWVFGTDALIAKITGKSGEGVMVTVAKNFDAPIKILFPREWGLMGDALEQCTVDLHANITAMLYNESVTDMPAALSKLGLKNETGQPLIQAAADSASALTDALAEAAPKLSKLCTENKMSMLGLGDIVIPGIFVALLLRFDHAEALRCKRSMNKTSFNYTFFGYVAGLALTVFIMVVFEAAQPALLYLVPGCIGMSLVAGAIQGNVSQMWSYSEEDEEKKDDDKDKKKDS